MKKSPAYDPYEHAERLGIVVASGRIRTANGLWIAEERMIILKRGLRACHERQVLAHEIGHVVLGHTETTQRFENQANRWAARKLIAPDHLAEIVKVSPDPGVWAQELGVTNDLMALWLADRRLS
jgi:Zn-dependent peptidase ImmA (M78 family)